MGFTLSIGLEGLEGIKEDATGLNEEVDATGLNEDEDAIGLKKEALLTPSCILDCFSIPSFHSFST